MSDELGLVVTAATGGAAGSIMALISAYLRDKRKENLIRTRARATVKHELKTAKDFIHAELVNHKGIQETIYISENTAQVQALERIIESLMYPTMSIEIKLITFDPDLQGQLQDIYLKIKNISVKIRTDKGVRVIKFERSKMAKLVEDADKVIQKIS